MLTVTFMFNAPATREIDTYGHTLSLHDAPPICSMSMHSSVLELIGDTPIVKARRLDAGACELYLKLENQNPGGSIKDRIGMSMIEAAEKDRKSTRLNSSH